MPQPSAPAAALRGARRRTHRPLAISLAALLLAACGPDNRPGTIVGQLYVILQTGNEAKMDTRPVRLIAEDLRLDSTLSVLCIRRNRTVEALKRTADSIRAAGDAPDTAFARIAIEQRAATDSAMRDRAVILDRATLRTVHTRPDDRFIFDSVPPGKYRLWSDADLPSGRWNWLLPVKVKAGDSLHVALNNADADDNPLKCPTPLGG
jgi:hypothetical protein